MTQELVKMYKKFEIAEENMKKKTSVLVLTGAITISNIGLTTSFADVNDETLLIQEKSTIVHSQVSIETDGSARIAGQDG